MQPARPTDDAAPEASSPAASRRSRARSLGPAAALVFALVFLRLATFEGWIPRVEIAGDSMAPTLLGEHRTYACPECSAAGRVGVGDSAVQDFARDESAPDASAATLVCPNCGFRGIELRSGPIEPGRRAWIDRAVYHLRSIRRGEIVALEDPVDPGRRAVKRVVGLPGERLRIFDGDVYVNGRRWRKSLDELLDVAVLVHDDERRPVRRESPLPERWREEDDVWTVYHQWRCFASPLPRTSESPVLDDVAFNPSESRELHEVPDQLFEATMTLAADSRAIVRLTMPDDFVAVVFDPAAERIEVRRRGASAATADAVRDWSLVASTILSRRSHLHRPLRCQVATCDGRLLVGLDGNSELIVDEAHGAATDEATESASKEPRLGGGFRAATASPWATGWIGRPVAFERRRIFRDLYWLGPRESPRDWEASRPLAADEYFLLGDNAPVSVDSRQWPNEGAVRRERILGRVVTAGDGR